MKVIRSVFWIFSACAAVLTSCCGEATCERGIELPAVSRVKIDDPFWSPRYEVWSQVTARDVFDKFEGHPTNPGETKNVFENFDKVARGDRNTGNHTGLPWFDGLVYESIRGVADLLAARPDPELLTLKAELLEAQGDLAQAYRQFDQALDPELVESCVYQISAVKARCNYLIRAIKERSPEAAAAAGLEGASTWT